MLGAQQRMQPMESAVHDEFDRLWDASPDLLAVVGFDGYCLRLNRAWEETLGLTPEELMSAPLADFVHHEDRAGTIAEMEKLQRSQAAALFENRFRAHDGSYRWLAWRAVAAPGEGKIHAAARDVTANKRTQRHIAAFARLTHLLETSRNFLEAGPEILRVLCESLEWDAGCLWQSSSGDQEIRCAAAWTSPAARLEEFAARSLAAAFVKERDFPCRVWTENGPLWMEDVAAGAQFHRMAAAGSAGLQTCVAFPVRAQGRTFAAIELFSRAMRPRERELVEALETLASQIGQFAGRLRVERQMRDYAASLEEARREESEHARNLARLARSLDGALRQSEVATRTKSEFLARMSHEIRTPLTAIMGMTELAMGTPLTVEQREYLDILSESSGALLRLVNDILDFSRIEAHGIELDRSAFSLREAAGGSLKALALRAREKRLELACGVAADVPDALLGDAVRLRQILRNLCGNAIKFTNHGEVILTVETEAVSADSATLRFSVADTGPGIPPEQRNLIFGSFAQADTSASRSHGGAGLGLTIASHLVSLMQGRLWLESRLGEGSTFRFTARFARARDPRHERPPRLPAALRGRRVLVAYGNATVRRIFEKALADWGLRPEPAATLAEALAALERGARRRSACSLLLADAAIAAANGFALLRKARSGPQAAPVILLTRADALAEAAQARQLGATLCLTIPVSPPELRTAVTACLDGTVPRRQRAAPHSPPAGSGPIRILVAEDNPVNQTLVRLLLEKRGHRAVMVANGEEALEALVRNRFDLAILDVEMPRMNGIEAALRIRQREASTSTHLPIVALTAHAMRGDQERCLAAGMDAYLAKPIQVEQFYQTINALAPSPAPSRSRSRRAPEAQSKPPGGSRRT